MSDFFSGEFFKTLIIAGGALALYLVALAALRILKGFLLRRINDATQRSNVEIFIRIAQYVLLFFVLVVVLLPHLGSGFGIAAGLMSAALGWALQRPISGIAAWLMVVTKRPFTVGDWVIIGGVKGSVTDITLTHIHIREIGGTISAEEPSGRLILVPNARLFEENIVNYTQEGEDTVLDEVKFTVTFEGNLLRAREIAREAAVGVLGGAIENPEEPRLRTWFSQNGMEVVVRYFTPAPIRERLRSEITEAIFHAVRKAEDVELAYPHTEVLFRHK